MRRMKRVGFMARWEITDLDRSVPDLIPEALEELPTLASEAGAVLIGPPVWTRNPVMLGGRPYLQCVCPAWRAKSHREHVADADDACRTGASLVPYDACDVHGCDGVAGRKGVCVQHRQLARKARLAVES